MSGQHRTGGPIPLGDLFDRALNHLPPAPPKSAQSLSSRVSADGLLFSGNRHDSVPRALLLDRKLTPLERNAWQVFRLMVQDDGISAMPTYDQLAPWLASMPCAARASHETVARTLTILRMTRWLSLVRRRCDATTGRILGNFTVATFTSSKARRMHSERRSARAGGTCAHRKNGDGTGAHGVERNRCFAWRLHDRDAPGVLAAAH